MRRLIAAVMAASLLAGCGTAKDNERARMLRICDDPKVLTADTFDTKADCRAWFSEQFRSQAGG